MQLFLTSNKKRIQKDFVLILFIYSTLNITKKGKGGKKKENFVFIYARNMPPYSKIDRRHGKKLGGRIEIKGNECTT